jgi:ATP-dependent exoDNAse (exonuclease V) beta subunit
LARPDFSGPQRALEEEKRLLYVALTRARRDLVLSAAKLEHMETQTTLFHLLPESLRRVMQSALTTQESDLSWDPRGNRHLLRVLREQPEPRRYQSRESSTRRHLALDAIPNDSLPRISVSALVREQTGEEISPWALNPIDLAVGGAVHRMFEYDVQLTDALVDVAEAVLPDLSGHRPSEKARAAKKAADLYTRLRQQPELQDLLTKGRVLREVPFALHGKERIVYGAIDSLILAAGQAVVIDYKTGKSRPEHRLQMELYLEAVRALFPGHQALGLVFYPQGTPLKVRPPADNAGQTSQLQLW